MSKGTDTHLNKPLPVVFYYPSASTTDRGLQFPENWFKNRVPHHLALRKWGLFFFEIIFKSIFNTVKYHINKQFNLLN